MGEEADRLIDEAMMNPDFIWEMHMPIKKKAIKEKATKTSAKKRIQTPAKKRVQTPRADKFELFLKAIAEKFPNDPTAPGLAIAWLPDKKLFYVAIRRFSGHAGTSPHVHKSETAQVLLTALNSVRDQFKQALMKTTATEEFLRS